MHISMRRTCPALHVGTGSPFSHVRPLMCTWLMPKHIGVQESIAWLVESLVEETVAAGATIVAEGDAEETLYIILRGGVDVRVSSKKQAAEEPPQPRLGVGQMFGEHCLAAKRKPCKFTVSCIEAQPSLLLKLPLDLLKSNSNLDAWREKLGGALPKEKSSKSEGGKGESNTSDKKADDKKISGSSGTDRTARVALDTKGTTKASPSVTSKRVMTPKGRRARDSKDPIGIRSDRAERSESSTPVTPPITRRARDSKDSIGNRSVTPPVTRRARDSRSETSTSVTPPITRRARDSKDSIGIRSERSESPTPVTPPIT